jgi:hypothetical protein
MKAGKIVRNYSLIKGSGVQYIMVKRGKKMDSVKLNLLPVTKRNENRLVSPIPVAGLLEDLDED